MDCHHSMNGKDNRKHNNVVVNLEINIVKLVKTKT